MPISEYILLAVLGSTAISTGASPAKPLAADVLLQPKGGSMSAPGQETPRKEGSRGRTHNRRHRRHIKHRRAKKPAI